MDWNLSSRPPRTQRLLVLTAVTGFVAGFSAVAIADGATRLFLGAFALFLFYDVAREIGTPGDIARRTAAAVEPAGPWLVGMGVFLLLNAIGLSLLLDRTNDGLVRFLIYAVVFATSSGVGLLVRSAVSRLRRYRLVADHH